MVDAAKFEERIQLRVRRDAKLLGKGVLSQGLAASGMGESYMRGDAGGLVLRNVRLVLAHCGVEASETVRRALEAGPFGRLIEDGQRLREESGVSWRVVHLEGRLRRHCAEEASDVDLASIDALRQDDSHAAEAAINAAMKSVSGARSGARVLGVWSSVQRSLYRLDWSTIGLGLAVEVADIAGDAELVTELLQRSIYVLKDRGELGWALSMAREVTARSLQAGNLEGVGKGLVDCGVVHSASGDPALAVGCCRAALEILPGDLSTSRFAAWQVLALSHHALGDVSRAATAAEEASKVVPSSLSMLGRLAWVRGRIAWQSQDMARAERYYRVALSHLIPAPYDAALVGAELVRVVWRRGHFVEANALCSALSAVADSVSDHPLEMDNVMSAALFDLVWAGMEARLNEQVIEGSLRALRDARAAATARLRSHLRP